MRRRRLLVSATLAAVCGGLVAPAQAARPSRVIAPADDDQWVMTTGGISVHPCRELVIEPNVEDVPAEHRPAARAQVQQVVDIYNGLIGRSVFRMGPDTSRTSRANDGHFVFELSVHGDPDAGTETVRYASGKARVVAAGTVDGGRHVTDFGGEMDLELNPTGYATSVDTFVHEVGHGLGFHHTVDARSIMSYSRTRRGYHPSLEDEDRWGKAWVKAVRALFPADCAHVTLGLRHDWRKGGPDKGGTGWFFAEEVAALEPGVDTVLEVGTDLVDGPNGVAWQAQPSVTLERLVLCRDDVFADCLGGSALAGTVGAVAFVPGGPNGELDDGLAWQLLSTSNAQTEVLLLGGTAAVSQAIEDRLRDEVGGRAASVTRIKGEAGTGRYGTAVAIADRMVADGASTDLVLLARSDNPVDAVAAGAIAARKGLPILLTEPGQLTDTTRDWLVRHAPARVAVLGGRAAVSDAAATAADAVAGQVERVSGANRRATSVAVARHPWLWQRHEVTDSSRFYLVNGRHEDAWALALAAAPWAARGKGAILLTEYDSLGFAEDGSDGRDPDPGWYLWSLRAPTEVQPRSDGDIGWYVMGTVDGDFTHPIVGSSAGLTANAQATYASDG